MGKTTPRRGRLLDLSILIAGIGWLVFILILPGQSYRTKPFFNREADAGSMLRAGQFSDLTQDVIGMRAISNNQDAYPELGPPQKALGYNSDPHHASTHPPTAFLLVSPIAWMPVRTGSLVWAWMMVACIAASFACMGRNVLQSVGFAFLSLAWTPAATCLGQLTAVWLLGVCAAYRFLAKMPALSGAMLAIAAATKIAPAVLVLLFRSPKAVAGFGVTLLVLLGVLLVKSPSSIHRYMQVNSYEVRHQFGRPDNASIVAQASRHAGKPGRLAAAGFLAVVLAVNAMDIRRGNLRGWSALSYLSVAVLPILWTYSLLPLLFLARWEWSGGLARGLIFLIFILISGAVSIWDVSWLTAMATVWLGLGLLVRFPAPLRTDERKTGLPESPARRPVGVVE